MSALEWEEQTLAWVLVLVLGSALVYARLPAALEATSVCQEYALVREELAALFEHLYQ
jgi:hypothetical protein